MNVELLFDTLINMEITYILDERDYFQELSTV